ncbi:MAG: hypothetical protein M0P95_07385 [Sulfuritalea sp.]|nr:hypothetical protein [Sulfuritalea sp.]
MAFDRFIALWQNYSLTEWADAEGRFNDLLGVDQPRRRRIASADSS